MTDKAQEIAKLYQQIDNAQKIIDDLEMDIEEMLETIIKLRSEIDE